jgi:hypothetical protein
MDPALQIGRVQDDFVGQGGEHVFQALPVHGLDLLYDASQ